MPAVTDAPLAPVTARLAQAGVRIGPHMATPAWRGERLDVDWAISVLWRPTSRQQPDQGVEVASTACYGRDALSPTLFNGAARAGIHARVDRLSPESVPLWGTMRATQLVCHVADQLRVALGDIEVRRRRLALRFGDREVEIDPGLLRFKLGRRLLVHAAP